MLNDVVLELLAHAVLPLPRISDEDAEDEEEAGEDGDAGTHAGGEAGALHWRWSIMLADDTYAEGDIDVAAGLSWGVCGNGRDESMI